MTITRLTLTAVVAFIVANYVTGVRGPILAPLTALLVVQATLYHTLRSAWQRFASVAFGVLLASGLSTLLGFTWWSLGITIIVALAVGHVLRLGDSAMEVPISAMLILALPSEAAVVDRILATLVGAVVGFASNLIFAPLRVGPAEEAIDDLGARMADLLDEISAELAQGAGGEHTGRWVARSRALSDEIERVERALDQAEESVRLNPRGIRVANPRAHLRPRLEAMEHASLTIRGIARSLNDIAGVPEANPVRDRHIAQRVAEVLRELASALRAYGRMARSSEPDRDTLRADVDRHLSAATDRQGTVTNELHGAGPREGWPLRGELVTHLERLRDELRPATAPAPTPPPRPPLHRRARRILRRRRS